MNYIVPVSSLCIACISLYIIQYNKYSKMIGNMLLASRKGNKDEFLSAIYSSELDINLLHTIELSLSAYMKDNLTESNDSKYVPYRVLNFKYDDCKTSIMKSMPPFTNILFSPLRNMIPLILLLFTLVLIGST